MVRMFIIYDDDYAVLGLDLEGGNDAIAIKTAGFACKYTHDNNGIIGGKNTDTAII